MDNDKFNEKMKKYFDFHGQVVDVEEKKVRQAYILHSIKNKRAIHTI